MCQRGKKDALPEGIRVLVCETLGPKAKFVGRDRPLAQVTDVGPLQTRWHLTCVNVVLRARKRVWLGYRHTWVHDGRTVPRGSEHGAVSASDREPSACDDGSTGHGDASGKCSTCACHSTSKRSSTDAMAGRGVQVYDARDIDCLKGAAREGKTRGRMVECTKVGGKHGGREEGASAIAKHVISLSQCASCSSRSCRPPP